MSVSHVCPKCAAQMESVKTPMALIEVKKTAPVPNPEFERVGVGLLVSPWRCSACGFVELYAP